MVYTEHHLNCLVRAVPFPTAINWYFQKCDIPTNCSKPLFDKWETLDLNSSAEIMFPQITNSLATDRVTNISRLSLLMKEEKIGWFRCVAINELDSSNSTKLYVSTGIWASFNFLLYLKWLEIPLIHTLIHHVETISNLKKLQTTEKLMWLLKDFKAQIVYFEQFHLFP